MTTLESPVEERLIETARALAPQIRAAADEVERERRLPASLLRALKDADFLRMYLPRNMGGTGTDPLTAMRVVEELARADGSIGWLAMVGAQCAWFTSRLGPDVAAQLFGRDTTLAGSISPGPGRAWEVEGGYRASGRWTFASGSAHADWFFGLCQIYDGDTPRVRDDGSPDLHFLFFPRSDITVLDTWYTTGLRGSGSNDFTVTDTFVPRERSYLRPNRNASVSRQPGPLYRGLFPLYVVRGSLALGIARHALDLLMELAATKRSLGATEVLRTLPRVQAQVAKAEALTGSARAYLYETAVEVWGAMQTEEELPLTLLARGRLAVAHAVHTAVRVTDTMYHLGGSTAIYATSPLDRCFRDINTAVADISAAPGIYEAAGQVFLGLEPRPGGL
jgi:alkylation response protein AidB-like acyl-CoA dehydrogenase